MGRVTSENPIPARNFSPMDKSTGIWMARNQSLEKLRTLARQTPKGRFRAKTAPAINQTLVKIDIPIRLKHETGDPSMAEEPPFQQQTSGRPIPLTWTPC
jgi:hypothetical protein